MQLLALELFKVKKGIANPILRDIVPLKSIDYSSKSHIGFFVSSINT